MDDFFKLLLEHSWAAAAALPLMALYTVFSKRMPGPVWDSMWRPILATLCLAGATVADFVAKGQSLNHALGSVMVALGPTILAEGSAILIKLFNKGGGSGGSATGDPANPEIPRPPAPYSVPLVEQTCAPWSYPLVRRVVGTVACAVLTVLAAGCAGALPVITAVEAAAADGAIWIDILGGAARSFFAAHPDAEKEAALNRRLADTRLALDSAVRALNGVVEASDGKTAEAFADFNKAYTELLAALRDMGVVHPVSGGRIAVYRGATEIEYREPLALAFQKRP